jgi:RecG-like helicase
MDQRSSMITVGDTIFADDGRVISTMEVARVTETQAVAYDHFGNEVRFRREAGNNGYVILAGKGEWNRTRYQLANPEIEDQYRRQQYARAIQKFDLGSLTTDQLVSVYQSLQTMKKENEQSISIDQNDDVDIER